MSLRPRAGSPNRRNRYRSLRWRLAVWAVVASSIGLGGIAIGLSVGLVVAGDASTELPSSDVAGIALEIRHFPSPTPTQIAPHVETAEAPSPTARPATPTAVPVASAAPSEPPPPAPPPLSAPASSAPPQPAPPPAVERAEEPPPEPPVVSSDPAAAELLLALVNGERRKAGLRALAFNAALTAAAQAHADAMASAGVMGHQLAGGAPLNVRVESAGYVEWSALAENVARGSVGTGEVVGAWMASPDHRANVLGAGYTEAGVGHVFSSETGHFWVLDLAAR